MAQQTVNRRAIAAGGLIAVMTLVPLALTATDQIYDTNFYTLWESTAVLAGDHPYRDFFEWGVPLQVLLSMAGQLLSGHRLIGEFLLHWVFITAGAVISFGLGVRASRSVLLSFVTALIAAIIGPGTGTYHYPKLFLYPAAVWLGWRYLDRPSAGRASALSALTVAAFLMRHDHGIYVGCTAVLAALLAPVAAPTLWTLRAGLRHTAVFVVTALLLLAPWIALVERSEGFFEYLVSRASLSAEASPNGSPFHMLLSMNPIRAVEADSKQPPIIGPWRWPADFEAFMWLVQATLLVPLVLLVSSGVAVARSRWRQRPLAEGTFHAILASTVLLVIDHRIIREPAYFMLMTPLTAALAARLLTAGAAPHHESELTVSPRARAWRLIHRTVALLMLLVTAMSVVTLQRSDWTRNITKERVLKSFSRLTIRPPIDGHVGSYLGRPFTEADWRDATPEDRRGLRLRYLYECSLPSDRVLITGSTPFDVPYFLNRRIAGGHLFWHMAWRSDPVREAQSLALLQRQSAPFVYAATDTIAGELSPYPNIRRYVERTYFEPEGGEGRLLVDRRRPPVSYFGPLRWPCFR
jgi:hypothetical protein